MYHPNWMKTEKVRRKKIWGASSVRIFNFKNLTGSLQNYVVSLNLAKISLNNKYKNIIEILNPDWLSVCGTQIGLK